MDPVSAIGLAGAIAGLIDVTSRSIVALLDLQSRYSRFSLKIRQISGQLSTLKAALKKIKDLIDLSVDDIMRKRQRNIFALDDEQLVADLVLSIDCCEYIIKTLDEQLDRFQLTSPSQSSGLSNVRTKVKFLWEESEINDYQGMLNNQINALNLLLTVTQCESFMEQGNLLRRKSSRQVFEKVKDDTSSILLQRDKDSFLSRQSSAVDDVDFIDTEFVFDRDLFSSKAYRSVARSWMRKSILLGRKQNSTTTITAAPRQVNENDIVISDTSSPKVVSPGEKIEIMTNHSFHLDYYNRNSLPKISEQPSDANNQKNPSRVPLLDTKRLQKRSPRLSAYNRFARRVAPPPTVESVPTEPNITTAPPNTNFLLLGASASGKSTAMKAIHLCKYRFNGYPRPMRMEFIGQILRMVEEDVMDEMLEGEFRPPGIDLLREQCGKVRITMQQAETQFDEDGFASSMKSVHQQLRELYDQVETSGLGHKLPSSPSLLEKENPYFLKAIDRVTDKEYTPSSDDTLWNYTKTTGIHEMALDNPTIPSNIPDLPAIKIIDVGGRRSERKKWIRTFDGVSKLFFFVDITGYDETLAEDRHGNKMHESFMLFESLVKGKWFVHAHINIIFHFMDKLERKIAQGRYPDSREYESDKEDLRTVDGVRDYFTRRFLEMEKMYRRGRISVHYTSIYDLAELARIFLATPYEII